MSYSFVNLCLLVEIQCINENEYYLMKLINDIGLTLKSNAVCTKIRQIKFGHFDLQHALLRKHWTLENILNNITVCKEIIAGQIYPDVPILKISRDEDMKL